MHSYTVSVLVYAVTKRKVERGKKLLFPGSLDEQHGSKEADYHGHREEC